jgi:ParB family transcriptional regulator, chromosome partitioning protein
MPPKRVSIADRTAQEAMKGTPPPEAATASEAVATPSARLALWREESARQEVVALDVTQLMPNRHQPRTIFDEELLEELAASIREHGVLQPIVVRPIPLTKWEEHARRFELIVGERRWRASIRAGQSTVPALIRNDADDLHTLIELALIENLQRADLHPLEEARAFNVMREELGYSYRKIAERVGRSKGYVENRLKLLDLSSDLQELVRTRPDTLMHVGELAKIQDPSVRAALITAVRDDALAYTETQTRVRALLSPQTDKAPLTGEVSLRKDTRDQQHTNDDASGKSSLRKDTHDQQHTNDPTTTTISRSSNIADQIMKYRKGIAQLVEQVEPRMDESVRQAALREIEQLMDTLETLLHQLQQPHEA